MTLRHAHQAEEVETWMTTAVVVIVGTSVTRTALREETDMQGEEGGTTATATDGTSGPETTTEDPHPGTTDLLRHCRDLLYRQDRPRADPLFLRRRVRPTDRSRAPFRQQHCELTLTH